MNKGVIGIVLGVVVGGSFVFFGETLGHYLFPAKAPLPVNPADWTNYMENEVPFMSKLFVLLAYALGAFASSIVSTFISGRNTMRPMLSTVAILNGFAIMNFLYIPHPMWMWIGILLAFFPMGLIAYFLIKKKNTNLD